MKKLIALNVAFVGLAVVSNAQIKKGNLFLGGSLGFTSNSSSTDYTPAKDKSASSFDFGPRVGYFLTDKIAIGAGLSISDNTNKNSPASGSYSTKDETAGFGFNVFGRYLFVNDEKFAFFTDLGLNVNVYANQSDVTTLGVTKTTKSSSGQLSFKLSPGVIWFPANSWGIEGSVGVLSLTSLSYKPDGGDEVTGSRLDFGLNSSLNLGVHYYFGKK